jgi:hypothetical protein
MEAEKKKVAHIKTERLGMGRKKTFLRYGFWETRGIHVSSHDDHR